MIWLDRMSKLGIRCWDFVKISKIVRSISYNIDNICNLETSKLDFTIDQTVYTNIETRHFIN